MFGQIDFADLDALGAPEAMAEVFGACDIGLARAFELSSGDGADPWSQLFVSLVASGLSEEQAGCVIELFRQATLVDDVEAVMRGAMVDCDVDADLIDESFSPGTTP